MHNNIKYSIQYKYKTIVKNFDVKYYRFEDFGLRNKVYKKMTRI
jgi:hypothetical protein